MRPLLATFALVLAGCATAPALSSFELPGLPGAASASSEAVWFAFDPVAFPELQAMDRGLVAGKPRGVVLPPGPPGSHDERIFYYGSVVRVAEGDLRMWYAGVHDPDHFGRHVRKLSGPPQPRRPEAGLRFHYATSRDGVTWTRPELGLVRFGGSTANNIVAFPVAPGDLAEPVVVLHDPDDPDPGRRFKMLFEYMSMGWGTAVSPDGLRWTVSPVRRPPIFEMGGVTRHRGRYYVAGQGTFPQPEPDYRRLGVYSSSDFVDWTFAGIGLDRSPKDRRPDFHRFRHEQIHLGAGLWNRGNVLLAVYGQWHGAPEGQEPNKDNLVGDLGLALSHDGVRFVEPVPGFSLVAEKAETPPVLPFRFTRALQQGQGMYNVGDETLYWYAYWSGPDVRLASWRRDRLGYLAPTGHGARAVSAPVVVRAGKLKVHLNAQVSPGGRLTVTVLDGRGTPVRGFEAATMTGDHLRQPLTWPGGDALTPALGPVRIQIAGTGDWKLHALYLGGAE